MDHLNYDFYVTVGVAFDTTDFFDLIYLITQMIHLYSSMFVTK